MGDSEAASSDAAVDQLQRSARQMVHAARGALDAIDDLISDKHRLGEVVTSFTDLLDRAGRAISNRPDDSTAHDDASGAGAPADGDSSSSAATSPKPTRVRRIPVDE